MKSSVVISDRGPGQFDGVGDFSYLLARFLQPHLHTVLLTAQDGAPEVRSNPTGLLPDHSPSVWSMGNWSNLWHRRGEALLRESEAVLLQYVPQAYFPARGIGWLLFWLVHARVRQGKKVIVTVHEYDIPWSLSFKRVVGRIMLNLFMAGLGSLADEVVATYGHSLRRLRLLLFWKARRVHLIPLGNNIAVGTRPQDGKTGSAGRISRTDAAPVRLSRRSSGTPAAMILTLFGQPSGMDHRLLGHLSELSPGRDAPIRVRWIGRSHQEILTLWRDGCGLSPDLLEIHERQPAEEVSRLLQSSDVFLAPLVDGVSTRRTTVIAALAHGLPVIGTDGPCTDPLLRKSPAFLLSRRGDGARFSRNLALLLRDGRRRHLMGRAAQQLYADRFTWERIAAEYHQLL